MTKLIAWIVGLVVVAGALGWWYEAKHASMPTGQVCTQEAMQCPDGSYVGRTGPNCSFAPCPTTTSNVVSHKDPSTGVSFVYPEHLSTKYVATVDWPPKVQIVNQAYSCTQAGAPTDRAGQTIERTINGQKYCVTTEEEGAAGSIYTNYAYATPEEGKTYIFTFSLRKPQCANYPEPQMSECKTEESTFSIDGIIDSIVKSAFLRAS